MHLLLLTEDKNFVVAKAPNNPASSYHPVAISQTKSTGKTEINHLLVVSDLSAVTHNYTFTVQENTYLIESPTGSYKVHCRKSSNSNAEMLLEKFNENSVHYIGYSVHEYHNSALQIQGLIPIAIT